jgi:glycosyltransferase involved in cell wall biosynthesis
MNKIIFRLKSFLNRYPRLKSFIKIFIPKRFLSQGKVIQNTQKKIYESFYIDDIEIKFSLQPLKDERGIGRVAKEQYNYFLKNLSRKREDKRYKTIYFHSSIHWCSKKLPKNTVIMIHDVIPMVFPELFPEANYQWTHQLYDIAGQANLIITISQTSKKDIVDYLDISPSKIEIVNNGVSHLPVNENYEQNLPKEYFVYLGSYDPHKNLNVILEALTEEKAKNFHLVMIGSNSECKPYVEELGIKDRVHFLGRLSDADIGFVLKNAIALLFPSLYEGFGLPPMEAGLLRVPSICSNKPTMTEFLDGVVLYADPFDEKSWLKQMKKIREQTVREKFSALVYERVGKFTWEKSCSSLLVELTK